MTAAADVNSTPIPADRPAAGLLTADEHAAIRLLGDVATLFGRIVVDGPTRDHDLNEVCARIHDLQHAVMAQAAARAYPGSYRRLGATVSEPAAPAPAVDGSER